MCFSVSVLEFIASKEGSPPSKNSNVSDPEGAKKVTAFPHPRQSHFQWAMKSIHASKQTRQGAYVRKHPNWKPVEAKAVPLLNLPTSQQQSNPETYSGQDRDQDGEDTIPSPTRATSEEEREIEGSSEGGSFPGGFEPRNSNMGSSGVQLSLETSHSKNQTDLVTVAEYTTLTPKQLVEQSTTRLQSTQEPDLGAEARGEILYVHRPTHVLLSASSQRGEGSSTSGFSQDNKGINREETNASTPETFTEVLTTSEVTTVEPMTTSNFQGIEPTITVATMEKSSERPTTEEPSISISWILEEKEKTTTDDLQGHLSTTLTPTEGTQTMVGAIQVTTSVSDSNVAATEMESRSAVSQSFVAGSQWTPFKDISPKLEEHKSSMTKDNKDANNPFGSLIPNWAVGLIPSGM